MGRTLQRPRGRARPALGDRRADSIRAWPPAAQGALGYEAAIFDEGRGRLPAGGPRRRCTTCTTRWSGSPSRQVKATLNRLHLERVRGRRARPRAPGGGQAARQRARPALRDLARCSTRAGCSGSAALAGLDAQLRARDWRGLLVANREQVGDQVRPIVIGHGLLEKLAAPYKAMTAHCLICSGPMA